MNRRGVTFGRADRGRDNFISEADAPGGGNDGASGGGRQRRQSRQRRRPAESAAHPIVSLAICSVRIGGLAPATLSKPVLMQAVLQRLHLRTIMIAVVLLAARFKPLQRASPPPHHPPPLSKQEREREFTLFTQDMRLGYRTYTTAAAVTAATKCGSVGIGTAASPVSGSKCRHCRPAAS